MDAVATAVRRFVAILGTVIGISIFVPIGGALWVVMILQAVLMFAWMVFVAALTTTSTIDPKAQLALQHSISFFPNGLVSIIANFQAMWMGTLSAEAEARSERTDYLKLFVNIVIAALFWAGIVAYFYATPLRDWMYPSTESGYEPS